MPQEAYFRPLNSDGLMFLECLNDACSDNGTCLEGYTGVGCTECEEPLVITNKYECSECPEGMLILCELT